MGYRELESFLASPVGTFPPPPNVPGTLVRPKLTFGRVAVYAGEWGVPILELWG